MQPELSALFQTQLDSFHEALMQEHTEQAVRLVYARYAGKEGSMRLALAEALKAAQGLDKKTVGQVGNVALRQAEEALGQRLASLAAQAREIDLARMVDVTLPGRKRTLGRLHPITVVRKEVESIFAELGFVVATGPQIETDFYNFQALAIPENHPARSMQDTFYLQNEQLLLRTHTSSVQVRAMQAQQPPVRILAPGKVYRKEDDPTHSPMFTQVEGLVVDRGITFADLKGTLLFFVQRFFGKHTTIRLRPSFFPFTEPSAELDISCFFCKGRRSDCRTCKGTGFIEVLGCGLVDPEVFAQVGYDAKEYTGFAFGMGLDRLAMLRYGVSDLKLFFSADQRFTKQMGAQP